MTDIAGGVLELHRVRNLTWETTPAVRRFATAQLPGQLPVHHRCNAGAWAPTNCWYHTDPLLGHNTH